MLTLGDLSNVKPRGQYRIVIGQSQNIWLNTNNVDYTRLSYDTILTFYLKQEPHMRKLMLYCQLPRSKKRLNSEINIF